MSLWCAYNHLLVSYLLVPFVEIYVSTFKELKSNLALLSMSDSTNINSRLLFSISTISAPKIDNTEFCTNEDLVGHWTLNGGERQINYPEIEFFNDSTVELYSQADTLYRYTYCLQNDSLYLNDINGRQYVNKINKVDDETIMFEGIADVKGIQIYHK